MCIFITLILPKSADLGGIRALAQAIGRDVQPQSNESVARQVGPDEAVYSITGRQCDCDTALGLAAERGTTPFDREKWSGKLRAKGWSPTKIERSLAQKEADFKSVQADAAASHEQDLERWESLLAAILRGRHAERVGLLLHMYGGGLDEDMTVASRELSELSRPALSRLTRDVIHEFRATHSR